MNCEAFEGKKNGHLGPRTRPVKVHVLVEGEYCGSRQAWVKAKLVGAIYHHHP